MKAKLRHFQIKTGRIYQWHTGPMRNARGSPSCGNEITLDSNLCPHEEISSTRKGNHTDKYKREQKCIFVTFFILHDLRNNWIKQ